MALENKKLGLATQNAAVADGTACLWLGNGQGDIVGSALALPEASSGARKLCLMQQTLGVIEQEKSPNNRSKKKDLAQKVGVTEQENSAL